jgi:hypothetical protein
LLQIRNNQGASLNELAANFGNIYLPDAVRKLTASCVDCLMPIEQALNPASTTIGVERSFCYGPSIR